MPSLLFQGMLWRYVNSYKDTKYYRCPHHQCFGRVAVKNRRVEVKRNHTLSEREHEPFKLHKGISYFPEPKQTFYQIRNPLTSTTTTTTTTTPSTSSTSPLTIPSNLSLDPSSIFLSKEELRSRFENAGIREEAEEYSRILLEQGANTIGALKNLTDNDFDKLGITKIGHRSIIRSLFQGIMLNSFQSL